MVPTLIALRRMLRTEWRYTYQSARREWSRCAAMRKWLRELGKGLVALPAHGREIAANRH